MSAKHTPGPWKIDGRYGDIDENGEWQDEIGPVSRIVGDNGAHVCGTCDGCNKIRIEDARLIAAAPDQHEALLGAELVIAEFTKAHNGCARGIDPCPSCITLAKVRAAIAAARGAR